MKIRQIILAVIILAAGIGAAVLLASARKMPGRTKKPVLGPLVETLEVHPGDHPVTIEGTGEAYARTMVTLVPQVSGRVISVSPNLVGGGRFSKGDVLLEIDPTDYELMLQRAEAAVARAEVAIQTNQAEARAAEQEWNALHPGEDPPSPLVLRRPQIRQAEAELKAALADLETARLNLSRTKISFPFDGIVLKESVDIGQVVAMGKSLATVYSTNEIEVRVPLAGRELKWFDLPGKGRKPSAAIIIADDGLQWTGKVSRLEGQIDPSSRMAPIIISVTDAFKTGGGRIPLYPGTFVHVRIQGHTITDSFAIPTSAVRENHTVWVVRDDKLRILEVDIARIDRNEALISSGLKAGDHIVTSLLEAVTDGMDIRENRAGGDA